MKLLSFIFAAVIGNAVFAQSFVNLNFENAIIQTNLGTTFYVDPSKAIPGWTAYANTTSLSPIGYNTVSLGGAAVFIEDSNAPSGGGPLPIQGNYSVLLQGSIPAAASTASIGQTGTIPVTAKSLTYWGYLSAVSFGGQPLSLVLLSSTANYNVYGADITAYAGLTGQLLFTAPVQNAVLLDNIQFSTSSIPEPQSFAFLGLGAFFFGLRRLRLRS